MYKSALDNLGEGYSSVVDGYVEALGLIENKTCASHAATFFIGADNSFN